MRTSSSLIVACTGALVLWGCTDGPKPRVVDGAADSRADSQAPDARDGGLDTAASAFQIGGVVTGLVGEGLVLQNNGGDALSVSANGSFTFATALASGAAYAVSVKTQPSLPTQTCAVTSGAGAVAGAKISNVAVTCSTTAFRIGGTVTGLLGTGLVLNDNGGDPLAISADGVFTFATPVPSGSAYAVTVQTQPSGPAQSCTVSGGTGVVGSGNVTAVVVNCATNTFVVGGTIAGLNGTLVLANNGGNNLSLNANGTFAFSTPVASGAAYAVTVVSQPGLPKQTCVVAGGTGTVATAIVGSVVVTCTTQTYAVGGTVTGLGSGATLILRNNAGDSLSVTANGEFIFATPVASGSPYAVTVQAQPSAPTQVCTITNGSGTLAAAAVTDVAIACVTTSFHIGGTVIGLASGATLGLRSNAADDLSLSANGAFTFATSVLSGSAYAVTVFAQPTTPVQTCVVSGATGTVGAQNVTGVVVNCTTDTFTVGGTITGLASSLVLQNSAGDNLAVSADGTFAFATPLIGGTPYAVTILSQPAIPSQTCTLTAASGTVTNANVITVHVACVTNAFAVGGSVSGLAAGASVVLQNNASGGLTRTSNGPFVIAPAVASGASYSVTVLNQPTSPTQSCVIGNGSGTVGAVAVTTISLVCTTSAFTIGGTVTGLVGTGLVLQDNGGDNRAITAGGTFLFATPVASGAAYVVTVLTQPTGPSQTCSVSAGAGTVGAGNVAGITVNCATNNYTVGGTVSGLAGTVVLRNNGGDDRVLTANGPFAFATPVSSNGTYVVTVETQPASPSQVCTVTAPSGSVVGADITSVVVACTTNRFTVGGTVSGLDGSGLVLRNSGGDDLTVAADGAFTFATSVASGLDYAVTVFASPTAPAQTCTLTNGTGSIGAAAVTNVVVMCSDNRPFGSGSDGALIVSGSVVVNDVSAAATGTSGQVTLTLALGGGFAVGQSVLLHQSQGTNAGDWERVIVVGVTGAVLTLQQPLLHSYTSTGANNHAQAIVAPQYTDVTVPAGQTLSAPPWNGTTGGILVFNASGTVTFEGTVSMKGHGYRGGVGDSNDTGGVSFKMQGESHTGPGLAGLTTNVANAGGGNGGAKQGGCEGGGGGGGGHALPGTNGGSHDTCPPTIEGGVGGAAYGDAALAKIFFGSGGGAGGYTADGALGRGGDGGGIVMIFGNQITIASSIDADGNDGTVEFGDYGGGGGAAGGSIYLGHAQPIVGIGNVSVVGGTGGLAGGRSEIGGDGAIGRAVSVP